MKRVSVILLLIFAVEFEALAQSEKLIVMENSDSLVVRSFEGEQVRDFIGNVRFSQENVRVTCNRAIQFQASGNIQLEGNVVILDDSLTMKFPRGMYFRGERRAVAYDSVSIDDGNFVVTARYGEYNVEPKRAFFRTHVVAKDTGSRLIADSLFYFRVEQRTIAMGRVEITSYTDNMTIRGQHFESWKKEQYSRMTQRPVLVKFDTAATSGKIDTLVVRSSVMEAYQDSSRKLIATDSVEIIRADLSSTAGFATFFTKGDSIMLRKSPMIWYQRTQVSGDSIDVFLKKRKLELVRVMGNSLSIALSDTLRKDKFDQIAGEEMKMHFGEDGLERLEVLNQAISVYHLYDDSLANGLNRTSGDRIVMSWAYDSLSAKQKLKTIKVFGGVEGQYFPENLMKGKESEFALAGFAWRDSKPQMRLSDFMFASSAVKPKEAARTTPVIKKKVTKKK